MKEFILILSVAAVLGFGYFIMKKLDTFLADNDRKTEECSAVSVLRVAFETPALIDSMADLLQRFSKENPNCELYLFYGSASEIKKGLGRCDLDFGFIMDSSADSLGGEYVSLAIPIKQSAIACNSVGRSVLPLGKSEKQTKVLWRANGGNHNKEMFVHLLRTFSQKRLLCCANTDGKTRENML